MTDPLTKLALKAKRGDRTAYEQLVRDTYDMSYRVAAAMTRDVDLAQDIVQTVWLGMPKKLPGFDGRSKFTTWLYRVVVNACKDQLRAQHRYGSGLEHLAGAMLRLSEENRDTAERRAALFELLDELEPPELRETAILLYIEGLSQAEASQVLSVKPGTIAWRASEIKNKLLRLTAQETRYA